MIDSSEMRQTERILLFIPMYNCASQISRVVAQLTPELCTLFSEVIVVDNRSTDGGLNAAVTALSKLAGLSTKVLLNDANYGLGGSHKVAFDYALANAFDYIVVLHGDDQGSIGDISPLISAGIHREVDCLLGARFMKGSRLRGYRLSRTLGNRVFNCLYSVASGTRIYDLGSGLNMYGVAALADRSYLRCPDDLTFNYQMILRSIAAKQRLRFFPLEWREDDQISNVKLVRQSLRVLNIAFQHACKRVGFIKEDRSMLAQGRDYSFTIAFEHCEARNVQ